MKKILITRRLLRSCEDKAKELFEANLNLNDELYSQKKLIEMSQGYDGILSALTDKLDAETINKLPETIKIISNFAVGFGNIDLEAAKKLIDLGMMISFSGIVTFKNASDLRSIVSFIPDEYLLIETDAPYLSPEPMRGKQNEPAFITHTARQIAELRGCSLEDIAKITSYNTKRLFSIK